MEIIEPATFFVYGGGTITGGADNVEIDCKMQVCNEIELNSEIHLVSIKKLGKRKVLAVLACGGIIPISDRLFDILEMLSEGRSLVFVCSLLKRLLLEKFFELIGHTQFSSDFSTSISFLPAQIQNEDLFLERFAGAERVVIRLEEPELEVNGFPVVECPDLVELDASETNAIEAALKVRFVALESIRIGMASDKSQFKSLSLHNFNIFANGELLQYTSAVPPKERLQMIQAVVSESWCELWSDEGFLTEAYCCGLLLTNARWQLGFIGASYESVTEIRIVSIE